MYERRISFSLLSNNIQNLKKMKHQSKHIMSILIRVKRPECNASVVRHNNNKYNDRQKQAYWRNCNGFNIGNSSGTSKHPNVGWKGRLQTWLALFAFDRF